MSYESFIKTPQIPDTVWELLKQPSSGAPAATGLLPKGIRLSSPAAQRREDSLRAVDRALRIGVKLQALAVWTAEGLNTLLSPDSLPAEVRERAEILFKGLSGLIDAGVDQLARASARVSHERRENILPSMGLSAADSASASSGRSRPVRRSQVISRKSWSAKRIARTISGRTGNF